MRIMMVGAGAVGGFFGAKLVKAGIDCSFLLRGRTLDTIRRNGLTIRSNENSMTVFPVVAADPRELPAADLIVLAVKRYDLEGVLNQLRPIVTPRTTLLTLQNGVDTEPRIRERLPDAPLLAGVAYIYSKIAEPGIIEHYNGYIVDRGKLLGISVPVNETMVALIKAIAEPLPLGPARLTLDGRVIQPIVLDTEALGKLPADAQVENVETFAPGMRGHGVRVEALLKIPTPTIGADHVTFHSADGKFAATLPLKQAAETGILLYLRDGLPFPLEAGGPFRLITPGLGDLCANVKNVARIEFTCGPGKDTRPSVPKQH